MKKFRIPWLYFGTLLPPLGLILLFEFIKFQRSLINTWVFSMLMPTMQKVGRFFDRVPFSVGELLTVFVLVGSVVYLIIAIFRAIRNWNGSLLFRPLALLLCVWLWIWAGMCWLWNCAYYADNFSQRSGFTAHPSSSEQLAQVTRYFAQQCAAYSDDISRDDMLHFQVPLTDCFSAVPTLYDGISQTFPILSASTGQTKPLFFSRLQSMLGFTGVYFPFTGEANINIDAPACLIPATIAHEMAHQRMIASEAEANFVGIMAAIHSSNPVFQYSGYLMGLTHLSNALSGVNPEEVRAIFSETFTPELSTDWNDNNSYWKELDSPVEEIAEQTYDQFLKQNHQSLGVQSYGACVDLLVTYVTNS